MTTFRFGNCDLDLDARELRRDGRPVHVEPQVLDVLAYLVTNRDRMVPKTELLDAVWGNRFVSDSALTSRIKAARSAVGDGGATQTMIRTERGRGYRFVGAATAADPVPTHSRDGPPPAHLPLRRGPLVGREADVDEAIDLLDTARLLTVVGPGGAGKTTLALEVARRVADRPRDGVWFVDLSGASHATHVAAVVAGTLELSGADEARRDSREAWLAGLLREHECVLVLDNCEHVVDACAVLADRILASCPGVRMIATSREPLAVAGEVQFALGPLSPDAAVELFGRRARAVSREVVLDAAAEPALRRICARLDGLPLAIELAAARVTWLSVAELADRLDDRFGLLTEGSRVAPARHQALRATVDWSHALLSEPEQVVLRRLSVFRGRWTVEDAERVCSGGSVATTSVLGLLGRLVDRSLVVAERDRAGGFRLLETIREYAAERLADAGEADAVREHHLGGLLALAAACAPLLHGHDQLSARHRLADRRDDLRAALDWCAEPTAPPDRVVLGQRLAAALGWFWFFDAHEEGRRTLRRLLDAGRTVPEARGRALQALSVVERPGGCVVHPDRAAATAGVDSAALLAAAGDTSGAALSQVLVAVQGITGDRVVHWLEMLDEASAALAGEPWCLALADFVRMEILVRWGSVDDAFAVGDAAAAAFARIGDAWGVTAVHSHRGHNFRCLGRLPEAVAAGLRALELARSAQLPNATQMVLGENGIARVQLGDEVRGRADLDEAVAVARRHGYPSGEALADTGYGYLARRHGDVGAARARFARAVAVLQEIGSLDFLAVAASGLGFAAQQAGDAATATRAHREALRIGRDMHEPWAVAAALEGLAGVALLHDEPTRAAHLLGAADAVRRRRENRPDPVTAGDITRITATARHRLGATGFRAAWAEGSRDPRAAGVPDPAAGEDQC